MTKSILTIVAVGAILILALPVQGQQAGKVYRIGYFGGTNHIRPAFRNRLAELGYFAGKNLAIEFRPGNRGKSFLEVARELVRNKVDLLLAVGIDATIAAKKATSTIPVVMGNSSADPVQHGLIDSLARPGGNVTGVIDLLPDLAGKRVQFLKDIFPKLSRIAHLAPAGTKVSQAHFRAVEAAARQIDVKVQNLEVRRPQDLERAFRTAVQGGAEALVVVGVSFFIDQRDRIIGLETKYRLPAIHTHAQWSRRGGLITYTTDGNARYRRAADYVARIFKGAKPADLPVERASKFLLNVNLNTAKALGITIPSSILLRADKVIE